MGWTYPDEWKALRNPHLRLLLLRKLHEIVARKDGHGDTVVIKDTVQLLFDKGEFGTEPGAEVGNSLFDVNEGRAVFKFAQAVLKAAQPGASLHRVRPADWAPVQTLALSACAMLARRGAAQFIDEAIPEQSHSER